MGYRLPAKPRSVDVRTVYAEQIDRALLALALPVDQDVEAIHTVRKHIKKLRGLLRLLRVELGPLATDENAVLRDAARQLSTTRDEQILAGVLQDLAEHLPQPSAQAAIAKASACLPGGEHAFPPPSEAVCERVAGMLRSSRRRFAKGAPKGRQRVDVMTGYRKTYKRARQAMTQVAIKPSDLNVHDYRKRVKDHWYHSRLLSPKLGKRLAKRRGRLRQLSEWLGAYQDLSVFKRWVSGGAADGLTLEETLLLVDIAQTRQQQLLDQAGPLGQRLFREKPKRLAASCG